MKRLGRTSRVCLRARQRTAAVRPDVDSAAQALVCFARYLLDADGRPKTGGAFPALGGRVDQGAARN
jgi:hypothetical protein